jgi:predicted DNA binding CopG/RHH family protein
MNKAKNKTKTTAENLEARFDAGEDVLDYFDVSRMTRPGHQKNRVNVDMPQWMIGRLDQIASRHGIARQALIKTWLAEKLKAELA